MSCRSTLVRDGQDVAQVHWSVPELGQRQLVRPPTGLEILNKVHDGASCHASKKEWTSTQFGVRIRRIQETYGQVLGRSGGWCEACQADLEKWMVEPAEGRSHAKKQKTQKDLKNENEELRSHLENLEEEHFQTHEAFLQSEQENEDLRRKLREASARAIAAEERLAEQSAGQ